MFRHAIYIPMKLADIIYDITKELTEEVGGCTTYKTTGFWNAGDSIDVEEVIVVEVMYSSRARPAALEKAIDAMVEAGEASVMVSVSDQKVDFISAGERLA